jgi:hypothetical protein
MKKSIFVMMIILSFFKCDNKYGLGIVQYFDANNHTNRYEKINKDVGMNISYLGMNESAYDAGDKEWMNCYQIMIVINGTDNTNIKISQLDLQLMEEDRQLINWYRLDWEWPPNTYHTQHFTDIDNFIKINNLNRDSTVLYFNFPMLPKTEKVITMYYDIEIVVNGKKYRYKESVKLYRKSSFFFGYYF